LVFLIKVGGVLEQNVELRIMEYILFGEIFGCGKRV